MVVMPDTKITVKVESKLSVEKDTFYLCLNLLQVYLKQENLAGMVVRADGGIQPLITSEEVDRAIYGKFDSSQNNKETKKEGKITLPKEDTVHQTDVRRVIEEWNKLQEVGINPIRDIKPSSKRYQLLKGRIREYGIDEVINAIDNVRNSDFLRGGNNRGWMITFDWFVKPNNFAKVLEGNYNKEGQHGNNRATQKHVKPLIPFDQCGGSEISDTPFAD